jgi:hypothetical protein
VELVITLPRGRQGALGILFGLCHISLFAAIIIRGISSFAELSGSVVAVGFRVPNTLNLGHFCMWHNIQDIRV